jgi:hydrogenase nickel incorporation protein HypA/HybF
MADAVEAIAERVGDARVASVRLAVGRLAAVVPDALRFCFDVCASGTPLEGAVLALDEIPGRGACRACGRAVELPDLLARCACGSTDIQITEGHELRLVEVELA